MFAQNVGSFMLNMSYAQEYAAHIKGSISDSRGNPIAKSMLDLYIDLESIILTEEGEELPKGTFVETSHSKYEVENGIFYWSVLPSKQPEFENEGYDITASSNGKYHQTKNVKVDWYQETVDGIDFVLADAIRTHFDFDTMWRSHADIKIPFSTYLLDETGEDSYRGEIENATIRVTVNGKEVDVETLGNGNYVASFNPNADLGLQDGDEVEIAIDFDGGEEHSALTTSLLIGPADVRIPVNNVSTGNSQANIDFPIHSANGKGYTVYVYKIGEDGQFEAYKNVNFNAKGAHLKNLINGTTYLAYIEYMDGTHSDVVMFTPGR